MPFVVNPGVIDPEKFLNEVLQVRLPNPFMPDTPQRITTDTSQKLSGMTLGEETDEAKLQPILSDAVIFGVDLCECGLAEKVVGCFKELMAGPGAVRATLKKYV